MPDAAAMVRRLRARGLRFEEYDLPDLKTTDSHCVLGSERAAWFRDPEGPVLCVHENLVVPRDAALGDASQPAPAATGAIVT